MKNYIDSDPLKDFGMNIIMRKYLCIPEWLPFIAFMEHGWTPLEEPLNTDIAATGFPLMFVYSKRRFNAYKDKKHNFKKIIISGMPFIIHRKQNKIKLNKNANGTIVFAPHSAGNIKQNYNIEDYCNKLIKLPDEYKPITICLHFDDLKEKEIYEPFGFNIVTAGKRHDSNFHENFYKILYNKKYSTSNSVGSHTFYSIDLGIPFFILGELPIRLNPSKLDPNVPEKYKQIDFKYGNEAYNLFNTGPVNFISDKQKKYVEDESGIRDSPSRNIMILIYWRYFFQFVMLNLLNNIKRIIKKVIKAIIPYGIIVLRRRYLSTKEKKQEAVSVTDSCRNS